MNLAKGHSIRKGISWDWLVNKGPLLHENHLVFVWNELEDMNLGIGHFIRKVNRKRNTGLDGNYCMCT